MTSRLKISDRAHVVLAYHKLEDQLSEAAAGPTGKIGTTARGIGPCYQDKFGRLRGASVKKPLDPEIDLGGTRVPIVLKRMRHARRPSIHKCRE